MNFLLKLISKTKRTTSKNKHTTKSGKTIKIHHSLLQKYVSRKDAKEIRRADRLNDLPKNRFVRILARLRPRRVIKYWFSRDGAIMALKITGISVIGGFLILVGLFAYFRKDLDNIADISGKNIGGSVLYYDRTGQTLLWEDVDGVKRIPVHDEEIANSVKQATIAVEDKDFFRHGGFDVRGIARAGINDVFGSGGKQGGSTITQQLVRLTQNNVGHQQTITRKIKEIILAVEMERSFNKQQILTGYLNSAPYGGIEYGVEAAARNYFQKSAKDLTLDESAMLAAIPKSPGVYSPYSEYFRKKSLVDRQHYILDQMLDQQMISAKERDDAKKIDTVIKVQPRPTHYASIKAPYFVLAARKELEDKYTALANRRGWKIITSLDMALQTKAEELVSKNVNNVRNLTRGVADEQAMVAEDVQTGQIVALVGGTDFNNPDHGKINYAHDAFIPPGSSFKPYDYAVLIENHTDAGAGSVFYDTQGPLPGYPCTDHSAPPPKGTGNCLEDYDFLHPGPLTLRYSLGGSRNVPAVKAMLASVPGDASPDKVNSINKVITTASAMMANVNNPNTYQCYKPGIDINTATPADTVQCYGASAIGDGAFLHLDDHVNGLSTLARLGTAIPRTYILKITDSGGKTIEEYKQKPGKQVLRPDSAYIVNDMASDGNASYLPAGYYKFHSQPNGWKFAVKTGTTNNGYDGLMTSWSTKYAVVSWVGNHTRNKELGGPGMEYLTAPLTRDWMIFAHSNIKAVDWARPEGVKSVPAFIVRNHIHYGDVEPSPSNDLVPSWYTGSTKKNSGPQTLDVVSNKLATSCTPERAKKIVNDVAANSFSIDIFHDKSGATTDATQQDDIHRCDDAKPAISITSAPANCNATCSISVNITEGSHHLSSEAFPGTVNIVIDGQSVQSFNVSSPGSQNLAFNYSGTGSKNISATIVDSVLYDGTSNSVSVTFTSGGGESGGGGSGITINSAKVTGSNSKFTWTGGSGTVTIYKASDNTVLCSSSSTNCQTSVVNAPIGTQVYARDTAGHTSSNATVST